MKIQTLTAVLIFSLFSATSVLADDDLDIENDAKNSVAIGGNAIGGTSGPGNPFGDSYNANNEAIAGSVVVNGSMACDCWDDIDLNNKSRQALAVGLAGAGSIILE